MDLFFPCRIQRFSHVNAFVDYVVVNNQVINHVMINLTDDEI